MLVFTKGATVALDEEPAVIALPVLLAVLTGRELFHTPSLFFCGKNVRENIT